MARYNHLDIEKKHQNEWEDQQIYAYESPSQKESFIIDTPPPTVSGNLHIGHIFSYSQTDIIARFQRMQDKNVFYPMGWDDNGLPTEKRTQNLYNVQCDPQKDYDPVLKVEKEKKSSPIQRISRKNFLEICRKQVLEDEIQYKNLWKSIALSVDWNLNYQSISPYAQILAQMSFLDLYKKGYVENRLSPVLWDTQFQTAVAQADVEDREQKGFFHNIVFTVVGGGEFVISSTRPELLPACVAVAAHPDDKRYKKFFGQKALVPLFHREVPIIPSPHAQPEKGTGILMICTFGDMEDVAFCRKQKLPTLTLIDEQGFFKDVSFHKVPFQSQKAEEATAFYSQLKGLRVLPARKKIVEILKEKNLLKGEPAECLQNVKFYEKGDFPLEILPKRQWYIKVLDHKENFLKQGSKIEWHPPSMKKRYEQWVEGLNQDWCISRQRAYGVPFPVWYSLDEKGNPDHSQPLLPEFPQLEIQPSPSFSVKSSLEDFQKTASLSGWPIDPLKQAPEGFKEEQRDQRKGFQPDKDVMDTWATSSLTPYINSGWLLNPEKHGLLFPADLRPQAHEIIRTWAFYTIVKSYFHEKQIPWKNIAVSGWVVNPNKEKMSKSKGNALTPENLIKSYSADAVRYWSARARLGQDTLYDENLFKTGQRLVTKIFNASRFVQMQMDGSPYLDWHSSLQEITSPIDRAWIKELVQTKFYARECLQKYSHAMALESIEKTFWAFCDNYLELVKSRVYQLKDQKEGLSGKRALDYSLYTFLKLFAPYLPYVTEEIWQSRYRRESTSIHKALWKDSGDAYWEDKKASLFSLKAFIKFLKRKKKGIHLESAFFILDQIRSKKSQHNKSLASPLKRLELSASLSHLREFALYKEDIARASHVALEDIVTLNKGYLKQPVVKVTFEDGVEA